MKEFTEVELSDASLRFLKKALHPNGWIYLQPAGQVGPKLIGGQVVERVDKNVLRLSTQMYHAGMPFSQMNTGTRVVLYQDYKRTNTIGNGLVRRKYFQPAQRKDWKIIEEIHQDNSDEIGIAWECSATEKEYLAQGLTPLEMEEKWFVYCENDQIHYFRSWTGIEIFRGQFEQIGPDRWTLSKAWISHHLKTPASHQQVAFVGQVEWHLRWIKRVME